jgi:hypothetical protein
MLTALLWIYPALASPDLVHITVHTDSFEIDHASVLTAGQFTVKMRCAEGVENPVVVINQTDSELFVTSLVGLARLGPAGEIGTHTATFRSLPPNVPALTVSIPHAGFTFTCAPLERGK